MTQKQLPLKMNLKPLGEIQRMEKLKSFLQQNPDRSLHDLCLFTSLDQQEVLRLQRLIEEERTSQHLPNKLQLEEWRRLKSGKKKLMREAWLEETTSQIELWADFGGERKVLATFQLSDSLMEKEVARKGAMNYLEIFWRDEMQRAGQTFPPESHTITRRMGMLQKEEIAWEPPGMPRLLDENF
jgi:hypothetical protein